MHLLQIDEPPQKITKLEIVEEKEEDLYDIATKIQCLFCNQELDRTYGKVKEYIYILFSYKYIFC